MSAPLLGRLTCFLCSGVLLCKPGDRLRFNNHMASEHGVVFELGRSEAAALLSIMNNNNKKQSEIQILWLNNHPREHQSASL